MTDMVQTRSLPSRSVRALTSELWSPLSTVRVGGIDVATASRQQLVDAWVTDSKAEQAQGNRSARLIFDLNGHALSLRETDPHYRASFDKADIIHADGGIVVSVSKLKSRSAIVERSATTDMIHDFAKAAEAHGLSFYLLGGSERVNREAASKLKALYPKLQIVGRRNGYFSKAEERSIVAEIAASSPHVLWIGLGKPDEQDFCVRNRELLGAKWAVTCGGCFNYITGDYQRAPKWMQNSNLEWLHRMATNPRLFWRYLTTTPHALLLLLFRA